MKLNLQYISNIIGESYKTWKPSDIIIMDSQTGTGKNHFIENVLIPWIGNKKMLFISNRTNLKREVKSRLLLQYGLKVPEALEELDKVTTIKNITISSYHSLQHSAKEELYKGKKFDLSYYDYLVMDECHFIMADGGFNNLNRLSFDKLVKTQYRNIIKIFMSGTMDEIKPPIIKCVEKGLGVIPKIHEYSTGKDYSYVNVKYFKHNKYTETITNMILNDTTDNKWLIFISDIEDGEKILKVLGNDKCSIIKSGTKDNKELNSIINDSCFTKKVLITTKSLDNGINIKDDLLTNIVIMAWDKTTFCQSIGRKRIDITNAQEINLYISMRYSKSFLGLSRSYDIKQKGIDLLFLEGDNKNQFNKKYDNNFKELVLLGDVVYKSHYNNEFMYNLIGGARLFKDKVFANEMIEKFKYDKYAFIKEQLLWIGKEDTFDECNIIGDIILDTEIETLESYLESIEGKKLFSDDQQIISDLVVKELITIDTKTDYRTKKIKPTTLETILRDQLSLPYAVSKSKKESIGDMRGKRYIIITKVIEE